MRGKIMQSKVKKWGNSLAIRIPKTYAEEAGITNNSSVEIRFVDGNLIISPTQTPEYDLDELLSEVTPENIHSETDTGSPMGRESW